MNQPILDSAIQDSDIDEAGSHENPTELLRLRVDAAKRGELSNRSVDEIVEKVLFEEFEG